MKWFRLYDEIVDDPKIMRLNETLRWRYIAVLCCINKYERTTNRLPSDNELTFHLRLSEKDLDETLTTLLRQKLIQKDKHGYYSKAFKNRQYESDNITARVQRFRQRFSNVSCNDIETYTETETDTEEKINNNKLLLQQLHDSGVVVKGRNPWPLIGKWKKGYSMDVIERSVEIAWKKSLSGDKVTVGYVEGIMKREIREIPEFSGKKEDWEDG